MADDNTPWLVTAAAALLGGGGFWAWLAERAKLKLARADSLSRDQATRDAAASAAPAQIAEALTDAVQALLKGYQERCDQLERSVGRLVARVEQLEDENDICRGENQQLNQRLNSMTEQLRRRGIDLGPSAVPGSFIVLEGDGATTLTPSPSAPRATDGDHSRDG